MRVLFRSAAPRPGARTRDDPAFRSVRVAIAYRVSCSPEGIARGSETAFMQDAVRNVAAVPVPFGVPEAEGSGAGYPHLLLIREISSRERTFGFRRPLA